jgi:hypothetical protein
MKRTPLSLFARRVVGIGAGAEPTGEIHDVWYSNLFITPSIQEIYLDFLLVSRRRELGDARRRAGRKEERGG